MCMHVCVCMYVYACMCMHVCVCMYVYACMCMHVCVCMYVYCVRVSNTSDESSDSAVGPEVVHREAASVGKKRGGGDRRPSETSK